MRSHRPFQDETLLKARVRKPSDHLDLNESGRLDFAHLDA